MKLHQNSKGFSAVEVLIVVAIFGIIGLIGYNVYSRQQANKTTSDTTAQSNSAKSTETASTATVAPEIKKTQDLDTAQKTLDSVDVDSSSEDQQLNKDLSAF